MEVGVGRGLSSGRNLNLGVPRTPEPRLLLLLLSCFSCVAREAQAACPAWGGGLEGATKTITVSTGWE